MRKYIRLSVILLAVISTILMIIYRYKYSKLSSVFEMINAFAYKDSDKCEESILRYQKSVNSSLSLKDASQGIPYWTEVFPGLYVYSAYWMNNVVSTLAFSRNMTINNMQKLKCELWYNNKRISSSAKFHILEKKEASLFMLLECVPDVLAQFPHSITFTKANVSSRVSINVVTPLQSSPHVFTACIKPFPTAYSDGIKVIEFLVYHHHIGINHFVFYDMGMSVSVRKILLEIAFKSAIHVTLLPWNVPIGFPDVSMNTETYFLECLLRSTSRNYSKFILNINLEHFIVPKLIPNLTLLAKDFSPDFVTSRVNEQKFCSEYPNDIITYNLNMSFTSLLKTKVFDGTDTSVCTIYSIKGLQKMIKSDSFFLWLYKGCYQKTAMLSKSSVIIHSYVPCNLGTDIKHKPREDKFMWQYKDMFYQSHMYRLAKNQKLISD